MIGKGLIVAGILMIVTVYLIRCISRYNAKKYAAWDIPGKRKEGEA